MKAQSALFSHFLKIRKGYLGFFQRSLQVLLFILLILLSAAAVAFPLWYWAIHWGQSFTWTVLAVLGGSLLYTAGQRFCSAVKAGKGSPLELAGRPILKILRILLSLLVLYGTGILFASPQPLWGIPALAAAIYLIGLLFFK